MILRKTEIGLGPDGPEESWDDDRVLYGKVTEAYANVTTNQQTRRQVIGVTFQFRSRLQVTYGHTRFRWQGQVYEPADAPGMPGGRKRDAVIIVCTLANDPD